MLPLHLLAPVAEVLQEQKQPFYPYQTSLDKQYPSQELLVECIHVELQEINKQKNLIFT